MALEQTRCKCDPTETQGRESNGEEPWGDRVVCNVTTS